MGSMRRPKYRSSPNLQGEVFRYDLTPCLQEERASLSGHPQPGSEITWDSVQERVVAVFSRKGLKDNELFVLTEKVRHLLKSHVGPLILDYFKMQLLTRGMVILREKLRYCEGQKLLDTLAEVWEYFFGEILPTLQAVFYPVQGKELSVRQMSLLAFRNAIPLKLKLDEALIRPRARVPPTIAQMLLVLESVHEPQAPTSEYLQLEALIPRVVSSYLGTFGTVHAGGDLAEHSVCLLEKRFSCRPPKISPPAGSPTVKNAPPRSWSHNGHPLGPLPETECDTGAAAQIFPPGDGTAGEPDRGPTLGEAARGPDASGDAAVAPDAVVQSLVKSLSESEIADKPTAKLEACCSFAQDLKSLEICRAEQSVSVPDFLVPSFSTAQQEQLLGALHERAADHLAKGSSASDAAFPGLSELPNSAGSRPAPRDARDYGGVGGGVAGGGGGGGGGSSEYSGLGVPEGGGRKSPSPYAPATPCHLHQRELRAAGPALPYTVSEPILRGGRDLAACGTWDSSTPSSGTSEERRCGGAPPVCEFEAR
ncbi:proline-rich protein 5-like [Petromyzon marinus]|uniref:Proline-rich protein 5-like isoform X1 n=1 Tax=Petromyzon marinus TaxID=7757 RepID=A0AAJ7STA4_PETMA|nr:proline-rich protein 5-like isoform X1 [Petromyzon marinus]